MGGYLLLFFAFCKMFGSFLATPRKEYCMLEHFNPRCGSGEVIIMQEALYGRMKLGRCMDEDRELDCYADVLDIFDNLCSGKQACDVQVGSNDMGSRSTCWKELLQYLEATYTCRKELQITHQQCSMQTTHKLDEKEILITSEIIKRHHECLNLNQPFTLSAKPGQFINVTLIDFNDEQRQITYGKVKDLKDGNEVIIVGEARAQSVINTQGHEIEITFYTNSKKFALDIKVLGCADLSPPVGAWMTRDGDVTELGCHSGKHTWRLNCESDKWIGAVGYCGKVSEEQKEATPGVPVKVKLSTNIIVFGVCSLVLLVSSIVFLIGVLILRRHNRGNRSMYSYHPAVPITNSSGKDLITFDGASLNLNGSIVGTLPVDYGQMHATQDYKSLQI